MAVATRGSTRERVAGDDHALDVPITAVHRLVGGDEERHRYWFQPDELITNSAAILVFESGSTTSQKKRTGRRCRCAPRRARPARWEKELAEEKRRGGGGDERQGEPDIRVDHPQIRHHLERRMMRTSTGSIKVTKIIQKKKLRSGKRK
jgi:hypothetical protein